jgi:hypothetical protein
MYWADLPRALADWNTPHVVHKHYLTVTEEHCQKAVENGGLLGD